MSTFDDDEYQRSDDKNAQEEQMIENVLNQPCSNPCVNNNVKLPIITAKIDIPL